MATSMSMMYLKHQIKSGFQSPLGRPGNSVVDETIPTVVDVRKYSSQLAAQATPPKVMAPELKERLEKRFDLRSARSILYAQNRCKFTHPISADDWYQCIGGNNGKLQMCSEDFLGYAHEGDYNLSQNGCSLNPAGVNLHNLCMAILKEFPASQNEDNELAVFKPNNPVNRKPPFVIVPETLEFLPLPFDDRFRYHNILTKLWSRMSEIPTERKMTPVGNPLLLEVLSINTMKQWYAIRGEMQSVCADIYEDLQCFMTLNYNPTELEDIDAEWQVELDIQNAQELEEFLAQLRGHTGLATYSSNSSLFSMDSDSPSPLSSPERLATSADSMKVDKISPNAEQKGLPVSLTPEPFDWADEVVETVTEQDGGVNTGEEKVSHIISDQALMQETLQEALPITTRINFSPAPNADITTKGNELKPAPKCSAISGFRPSPHMVTIFEDDEGSLPIFDESELQYALQEARPIVTRIQDDPAPNTNLNGNDSEFSPATKRSAILGFRPHVGTIYEEDESSLTFSDESKMEESLQHTNINVSTMSNNVRNVPTTAPTTAPTNVNIEFNQTNLSNEFNPPPKRSAISDFKPQVFTIFEEDDPDKPFIDHTARNDKIMQHFMIMACDKYNICIVEQFLLDPSKYFSDDGIEVIVERVNADVGRPCFNKSMERKRKGI